MADIKSSEARSLNMSRILGKDTKPETYVRKLLFNQGYRYRKNVKNVFGHPDIWMPKYNTAIFVNGCFWHRHAHCKYAYTPKSRVEFWEDKFQKNVMRDELVRNQLQAAGVKVLIIWECTVKKMMKAPEEEKKVLEKIIQFAGHGAGTMEL